MSSSLDFVSCKVDVRFFNGACTFVFVCFGYVITYDGLFLCFSRFFPFLFSKIQVVTFATEHNWDSLDFFDGVDGNAPRLGSYSGKKIHKTGHEIWDSL